MRMPAKTRVFRLGRDRPAKAKDTPASLGVLIPETVGWSFIAISDARRLLCWAAEDQLILFDFAAGRRFPPVEIPNYSDDAQNMSILSDCCLTDDYLLVAWDGLYCKCAIPSLFSGGEFRGGNFVNGIGKVIPANGAGEGYENMILTLAGDGEPGLDLVSVDSHEIRRTYRVPADQPKPGNHSPQWLDVTRELVVAGFPGQDLEDLLAWDIETGRLRHRLNFAALMDRVNLDGYFRRDFWQSPFLNDQYLHYGNVLVEVPTFRPVHTFDAFDIVGIAGDYVVTATWAGDPVFTPDFRPFLEPVFSIYQFPGFQKVGEVTIEGYGWVRKLPSRKFFLLEKVEGEQDFILVNIAEFCQKNSG